MRTYGQVNRGIPMGFSLLPVIGACYLCSLDQRLAAISDIIAIRFMDDILVMAKSRWKLRKAIQGVNKELTELNLEKHSGKTYAGRVMRKFDFLGYHIDLSGIGISKKTIQNHVEKTFRLYE